MRRLVEKYMKRKSDLDMVFIDLEKTYEEVPMNVLSMCLKAKGILMVYIVKIKNMHEGTKTMVRTTGEDPEPFLVKMGLHFI